MALTYNKATRDLSIKGQVTFANGEIEWITSKDIINYSFDQQIGSEGLPLGSAEAASFSLELSNVGRRYTPEKFDNAEIHMFVGIKNGEDYEWSDFGVWYVEYAEAPEQSVTIQITGYDALATRFEAVFTDNGMYPTTFGNLARTIATASGIKLADANFFNSTLNIEKKPAWADETTLREVLSYIAIAAAGYARITRNGMLEIVSFSDGEEYEIGANLYQRFGLTSGSKFELNCIEAMAKEDAEDYTRFAIDENIASDATNTIQLDWNPLLTATIVNSIIDKLAGMKITSASIEWGGDPNVMCCDWYTVHRMDGGTTRMMITRQAYSFDGGLSVSEGCEMPSINAASCSTYSTSTNMYDSNGNLNATHISGLNREIINATAAYIGKLDAESIETNKLIASYITALELAAKNIKADNVTTDKLTATVANIIEATIEKIKAGTVTTDELNTAIANIVKLNVDMIEAGDINVTGTLAASLAQFVALTAGTANFDKATVQHLVAEALNLQFGTADQVYIKNLAVEYAQIVGATIGNLCIKSSDGGYYSIDVDADGNVIATPTDVTDSEIEAGKTESGKVVIDTDIVAGDLNASNILATYALINKIDAARIDVDQLFAREAFLNKLVTSQIFADGGTLKLIAEAAGDVKKWFEFTNDRGLIIRKPEYTDADGVFHPSSIWYTLTDEVGYHIYSTQHTDPVGSFQRGGLNTTGVSIGDITCKRTTTGGWVWTDA